MTKKLINGLGIGISSIVLLAGCASKPRVYFDPRTGDNTALIRISNGMGAPSWGYNESKAFRNALEVAARLTLKKGYKYFAIVKPDDISNIKGSLKNTAKEVIEYCSPSVINIAYFGQKLHRCGTYNTQAQLLIEMYNVKRTDYTVFDAKKVLEYLKKHKLSDNLTDIEEKDKFPKY
jgi:hypothetical protein